MKNNTTDKLVKELKKLKGYELRDVIAELIKDDDNAKSTTQHALHNDFIQKVDEAKSNLKIGDKVFFKAGKKRHYQNVYGKVIEIRRKNIVLNEYDSEFKTMKTDYNLGRPLRWRVTATLLEKIA